MLPRRHVRAAVAGVIALSIAACGEVGPPQAQPVQIAAPTPVLVPPGRVVVVRGDGSIVSVSGDGQSVERVGALPPDAGEPDAVAVGRDGRLVLVSAVKSDDDDSSVCTASVLQVLGDGTLRRLATGAAIALSPDGDRLAYFVYGRVGSTCRRTDLVVRDLTDGTDSTITTFEDAPVGSLPPEWPVNWSPDGQQLVHVTKDGAVLTDVRTGVTSSAGDLPGAALAPVWLPGGELVVLDGCCIGGAVVRSTQDGRGIFDVPGPLRSIRAGRDDAGTWMTVEERGLFRWDGTALRPVLADALLTSG